MNLQFRANESTWVMNKFSRPNGDKSTKTIVMVNFGKCFGIRIWIEFVFKFCSRPGTITNELRLFRWSATVAISKPSIEIAKYSANGTETLR
jgi:hypothetical protein